MRWLLLASTVALRMLAACGDDAFRSDEGRFSIRMPNAPQRQVVTPDPSDPTPMHIYAAQRGTTAFLVAFADVRVEGRKADEILDGARDNALNKPGRSLLAERSVALGGNPGRELEIAAPNDLFLRVRVFLVGARLYQVSVVARDRNVLAAEAVPFLDSFKVF